MDSRTDPSIEAIRTRDAEYVADRDRWPTVMTRKAGEDRHALLAERDLLIAVVEAARLCDLPGLPDPERVDLRAAIDRLDKRA